LSKKNYKKTTEVDDKQGLAAEKSVPIPLKTWQKIAFICFPIILVLLLEGVFHWLGYGEKFPLFIPQFELSKGVQLYRTNPQATVLFFLSRAQNGVRKGGSMLQEHLLVPKPKNAIRVLFVGESTVEGYPYPKNLCSPAFLSAMLKHALPGKDIQVLNLGLTAGASYPIWKITEQALNYQPDLMIIYTGHNEYFGAFGVASLQSAGNYEWEMNLIYWFRHTAIFQAFFSYMDKWHKQPTDESTQNTALIDIMAKTKSIPINSSLRKYASRNLERHLEYIIEASKKKNIPVVLCTLISNEHDMAPLQSPSENTLSPDKAKIWKENYDLGIQELNSTPIKGYTTGSVGVYPRTTYLKKAVEAFPEHGLTHYRYAQALEKSGDTTDAVREYETARDLDEMPWRAAETTNQMIRDLAKKENVWLSDVDERFHQVQPEGIGWRLVEDHLHPSMEGQVLLARTVFDTLQKHQWLSLDTSILYITIDWMTLARILGYNSLTEFKVSGQMSSIFEKPPFQNNNEQIAKRFLDIGNQIENSSPPPEKKAIEDGKGMWHQKGAPPDFNFLAGDNYLQSQLPNQAKTFYYSAWQQAEDLTVYKIKLACDVLLCAKMAQHQLNNSDIVLAQKTLSDIEIISKNSIAADEQGDFYRACGQLYQFLNRHQEALEYYSKSMPFTTGIDRQRLAMNMAQSYYALQQMDKAKQILAQEQYTTPWNGPELMLKSLK
jgi:lysophospholipase L1-like esterase